MAWFNRVEVSNPTEKPSISPDTEPTMWEKVRSQSWFDWLARIVVAIILVVIILFGARAIHHHYQNKGTAPSVTVRPGKTTVTENKPVTKAAPSSSSTPTNKGSSNSTNGSSSTKTTTPPPTQVPNTGPGDVVAIFVVATFAATSLHYVLQLRRA